MSPGIEGRDASREGNQPLSHYREYLPHPTLLASPPPKFSPSLRCREAEGHHLPKGTMMGQVMLYVMTTVKTHIIQA